MQGTYGRKKVINWSIGRQQLWKWKKEDHREHEGWSRKHGCLRAGNIEVIARIKENIELGTHEIRAGSMEDIEKKTWKIESRKHGRYMNRDLGRQRAGNMQDYRAGNMEDREQGTRKIESKEHGRSTAAPASLALDRKQINSATPASLALDYWKQFHCNSSFSCSRPVRRYSPTAQLQYL